MASSIQPEPRTDPWRPETNGTRVMSDGSLFSLSGPGLDIVAESAPIPSTSGIAAADPTVHSQSLYRKYRPQSFDEDDLFGQEHVVNTLRNAIALGRLAHAYLFCGPRGTGKTTTARLLAKAVNCLDPDPYKRPCNVCAACVAINKGATTDVIEIDAASNRGIDDIRDLRERVKYAPTQLRTKFYIIDEAHQITGAAANAFLKTLEEPPAHTKFVLATTDPEELLQTIVSRCQRFDFRRINLDAMQACIRKVAREEHIEIQDDAVLAIARHATGSLRDALGLLDQVAVYRDDAESDTTTVTIDLVRTVLGVSRNDRVEAIVAALADHDPAAGLTAISAAVEAGEDMRQLGRQLLTYLRMLLIQRAGGVSDADDAARALADRFQLQELADLVRGFAEIDTKVKHATLAQLPLELAIVDGALRDQRPASSAPQTASASMDEPRQMPRRETPRDAAPRYQEPERNPFDDDLGAPPPPPPPYEGEFLAERPNRPSLRDRVRGTASAPATPPQGTSAPREESRPARPRPEMRQPNPGINETPARYGTAPRNDAPTQASPSRPGAPAAPTPIAASPSASSGASISIDTIVEQWVQIRNDVKAVNRRTEALLQQVDPAGVAGDTLVLVSPYEFHRNKVNSDEARGIVEDVIQRRLNRRMTVTCVTREEAQAMIAKRGPAPAGSASVAEPVRAVIEDQPATPEVRTTPPPAITPPPTTATAPVRSVPSQPEQPVVNPAETASAFEPHLDEQRIKAVQNIFDAEDVDEDTEFV
ncbi:MAG: DNA polymerase III subunit gamma/tau [Thermomicrobiales bacterium]